MNFENNVKTLRIKKGMTQAAIAKEFGVTRTTWVNYEAGRSTPSVADLIKMAKYFAVTESELLHGNMAANK